MLCRLLAPGVLILAAASAIAAPFHQQHGHWTVMSAGPTACLAINRPPEEFNAAPFNSLSIRQRRGASPVLQVFAWPDRFKPNEAVTVTITIGGTRIDLPARTFDSYGVETGALPGELIALLRDRRAAEFVIGGVPQLLLFDISALPAVLDALAACDRDMPG
jgi:hypothetical protein